MLKVTEIIPAEYPTLARLSKLKAAGIETDGHIDHLREIITSHGFNLPSREGEYYICHSPRKTWHQ